MCIICTGEIYKEDLDTLTELNVSFCSNLTSEKLQKFLIQCKNLEELYCYSCHSLTSLHLWSVKLVALECSCTSLTSLDLRNNINLITLNCSFCTFLTSLDLQDNINLTKLECSHCTSLTSLDLRNNINLNILECNYCRSLTSLDLRNLKELGCNSCRTSLDLRNNKNLTTLSCYSCRSLTSLDLPKKYKDCINYSDCHWISQNEDFSNNLQRLIKLQRWYRKLLVIKYMKSQEFIEWIYNPNNMGGYLHKKKLLKEYCQE